MSLRAELDWAFKKNVRLKEDGDGWTVECRKGLWSVYCGDRDQAEREARRYFIQYYRDGEYDT